MRFLVTNDDGILAHGLECLVRGRRAARRGHVVAPDREQSATSHSLTLHHPLRPVRRGERRWQVDGTPTDCVMLARRSADARAPRLRAQRHQPRAEHGRGRALLGHRRRGDGRARARHPVDRDLVRGRRPPRRRRRTSSEQVPVLTPLLRHLTSLPSFPAEHAAQREPAAACRPRQCKGVALTRLGRRVYSQSLTPMKDPWGREIFWIGGGSITWTRRGGFGLSRDPGRLHLGDAAASRPHALRRARRRGDVVAGPVDGADAAARGARLVETLREKGIRDLAVLRAFEHDAAARVRADRRCATARTRTRRCRSATGRRSRSRRSTRAISSC